LTPAERGQWGITCADGVLRVRSTLPILGLAVGMTAFAVLWFVTSLGAVTAFGLVGVVLPLIGVAFILGSVSLCVASVVATAEGLAVRRLRVRRFPWDHVDDFLLTDRPLWRAGWNSEFVVVVLHNGKRVYLAATQSPKAKSLPYGGPSAASVRRDVLRRYRETFAAPTGP